MMIHFDHTEPSVIPDPHPNRQPPIPPSPAPDGVPVRDPARPEHPAPVKEPPSHEPPIATSMRRAARQRLRALAVHAAHLACRRSRHAAQ